MGPWLRPLGRTGLAVSAVCAGGGPLGSMPGNFGYDVSFERGVATVARVLSSPISFLDTSNSYSEGESERRIGAAIAAAGGMPDGFVLATKVDRDAAEDFGARRVRASFRESVERLGLDHIDLLYLHDPEFALTFEQAMAAGGPVEELRRLKDEGLVSMIGVAGGEISLMHRFVETGAFDVFLTHNRYTLVDRSASETIDLASSSGVGVVNGAVLGGGILATGAQHSSRYAYREASEATLSAIRGIEGVCKSYDVPLAAAAMQFSLRDDRIASTIVGFSRPERVDETMQLAQWPIPDELWNQIEPLVPSPDNWQW